MSGLSGTEIAAILVAVTGLFGTIGRAVWTIVMHIEDLQEERDEARLKAGEDLITAKNMEIESLKHALKKYDEAVRE